MYRILLGSFVLFVGLCCHTASHSEPQNLSLLHQEVIQYHDSGLYQQELAAKIQEAQSYIIQEATQKKGQKLAIVLDIDETSLSNYDHIVQNHFIFNKERFHAKVMEAQLPVIPSMLTLYQECKKHNISVFFITGRHEDERQATQENLKKAGYAAWSGLYLKPQNYHESSIVPFKSKIREAIAKEGYTILATIGDQDSDILGGFAKKGFKLPNPYYFIP